MSSHKTLPGEQILNCLLEFECAKLEKLNVSLLLVFIFLYLKI